MENPIPADQNRTADNPNPNPNAGDQDRLHHLFSAFQSSAASRDSSDGFHHNPVSVDPLPASSSKLRPLQTDFFREVSLFNAHVGSEPEISRWSQFLPEYLRPGNLENYLKQTNTPQFFGDCFWWASQESYAQDCRSRLATMNQGKIPVAKDVQKDLQSFKPCSWSSGHIQYSRDQLLQLREEKSVSEAIFKIKQQIEVEFGVNKIICGPEPDLGVSKTEKRGMSDERKAKKKMKTRKKRAEKNRKLGVKRPNIQPILQQKPASHCRHYQKGRCYEGDACKFSHDVDALEKSKPCCHFARQACMKGDDCPFDHNLSKYPCNNYASAGFCSRGESCLFSHEITRMQDPMSAIDIIKPETKSLNPSLKSDSIQKRFGPFNSEKVGTANTPAQKSHLVYKTGAPTSSGTFKGTPALTAKPSAQPYTPNNIKDHISTSKANEPVKVPKGFTFLNIGNIPPNDSASGVQASQKTSNGADAGVYNPGKISEAPSTSNVTDIFIFGKSSSDNHGSLVASAGGKKDSVATNQKPNVVVPFKLPASTSSSNPFLPKLENAQVKNTTSSGQRSLLSTLGFASKFGSGVMRNPLMSTPAIGTDVSNSAPLDHSSCTQQTESPINVNPSVGSSSAGLTGHSKPANPAEIWGMLYGGSGP